MVKKFCNYSFKQKSFDKTGVELHTEFYTYVLSNRLKFFNKGFPKLNLNHACQEAFLMIFHEILKAGKVIEPIQALIQDEILSSVLGTDEWFSSFAESFLQYDREYFVATAIQLDTMRKLLKNYIIESTSTLN